MIATAAPHSPPALAPPSEALVAACGRRLIAALPSSRGRPMTALHGLVTDRVAADPALQAALFRLVDVTPACRSLDDVGGHLGALLGEIDDPRRTIALAQRMAGGAAGRAALGAGAKVGVRAMAARFIAGADAERAGGQLGRRWEDGVANTVDLLGEATVTEAEGEQYLRRCLATLDALAAAAARWPARPHLEHDRHGVVPRVNLSVKVSALTPHSRSDDPARGAGAAADRLRELLRRARELGAHLHIDMESLDLRDTVTDVVLAVLSEPEFRDGPSAGLVMQGYLRDSPDALAGWLDWAAAAGRTVPLTVRLVKGAYWDHEVVAARQAGWPVPVFDTRAACDRNFEHLTRTLLAHTDLVRVAIASHNMRSIAHALACAEAAGVSGELEIQVLRGLGDDLQDALATMGVRVRTYSPIGGLVAGMAYLVRRLLENTSNDSFLRARAGTDNLHDLLVAP